MEQRTIQLTHAQMTMVCEALQSYYLSSLKMIEANRRLLDDVAIKAILTRANAFDSLRYEIDNGDKDI